MFRNYKWARDAFSGSNGLVGSYRKRILVLSTVSPHVAVQFWPHSIRTLASHSVNIPEPPGDEDIHSEGLKESEVLNETYVANLVPEVFNSVPNTVPKPDKSAKTKALSKAKSSTKKPPTVRVLRLEITRNENYYMMQKLEKIQEDHQIFKPGVKRVIDLGCVPGNWSYLAKKHVMRCNGYSKTDMSKDGSFILGIDLLIYQPPEGISTMQGNIMSQSLLDRATAFCKEMEMRHQKSKQAKQAKESTEDTKEGNTNQLHTLYSKAKLQAKSAAAVDGIDALDSEVDTKDNYNAESTLVSSASESFESASDSISTLNLGNVEEENSYFVKENLETQWMQEAENSDFENDSTYKVDLMLSDLGLQYHQRKGFWNNTTTRPHIRSIMNKALKSSTGSQNKSVFDAADAALIYSCELVKEGGTLVLRLPGVSLEDPEFPLLESRLRKIFREVQRLEEQETSLNKVFFDILLICKDKDDTVSKIDVFS